MLIEESVKVIASKRIEVEVMKVVRKKARIWTTFVLEMLWQEQS